MYVIYIIALYVAILIVVFLYRLKKLKKYKKSNVSSEHETVSILWAWSSISDIVSFNQSLAKNEQLMRQDTLSDWRLFHPLNLLGIFAIILYQLYPRRHRTINYKRCIYTPNCSNYAIGVLRRYSVIDAVPRIIDRLKSCDGRNHTYRF